MNKEKAVERIDKFLEVMIYTRDKLKKVRINLKKKTAYHYSKSLGRNKEE